MPALPPVPKVVGVKMVGTYDSADWVNTHYVQYTGSAPTVADLTTLCTDFEETWDLYIRTKVSNDCVLSSVVATDLDSDTGNGYTAAVNRIGSDTGANTPANVACCVSAKIARRYRGGHPRFYIAGIPQLSCQNGMTFTEAFRAAMQLAMSGGALNWLQRINTKTYPTMGTIKLAAVSRYAGHTFDLEHNKIPTPRATPLVNLITGYVVDAKIDSQRRRLR